jgi:hypothetical protein
MSGSASGLSACFRYHYLLFEPGIPFVTAHSSSEFLDKHFRACTK